MGCARKVALSVSFLCFLLLLVIVSLSHFSFRTIITIPMQTPKKTSSLHLNFVSKRRVPNGPDPIHNRRVGTTRLPPT
ncbi:CLAVATA3/ESR (CLE)-related protein 25 [Salvia hispanica]|uniref:CLAVATA3/ESR (CLE)-related protein 25 n=1 Tax=Salvia hispanica TaxID=49212 RepID=UPI002009D9C8|nr:CLAVATA3/ESR (CLE)-related protein 25 [Salvia hispanica]